MGLEMIGVLSTCSHSCVVWSLSEWPAISAHCWIGSTSGSVAVVELVEFSSSFSSTAGGDGLLVAAGLLFNCTCSVETGSLAGLSACTIAFGL